MCGKYTDLSDAYLSVIKALQHACMTAGMKLQLTWVEAQYLEPEAKQDEPEKYEESWKKVSCDRLLSTPSWCQKVCACIMKLMNALANE